MNIEGKVIHFLGDSITEGVGATDASHCFVSLIGRKTGAVVHNYGVGGTRIARQLNCPQDEGKDFCARFIEMEQGADMIIVFGGTNDYGHGNAPFGSFEDKTPDTFNGALNVLFSGLRKMFPHALILSLTPLPRKAKSVEAERCLEDYANAIVSASAFYKILCLDLYHMSSSDKQLRYLFTNCLPDGLHPNDEGHQILAETIIRFLERL